VSSPRFIRLCGAADSLRIDAPLTNTMRSVAEWMRRADSDGALPDYLTHPLTAPDRAAATIEGWILGLK
jgi:hypothetical protein